MRKKSIIKASVAVAAAVALSLSAAFVPAFSEGFAVGDADVDLVVDVEDADIVEVAEAVNEAEEGIAFYCPVLEPVFDRPGWYRSIEGKEDLLFFGGTDGLADYVGKPVVVTGVIRPNADYAHREGFWKSVTVDVTGFREPSEDGVPSRSGEPVALVGLLERRGEWVVLSGSERGDVLLLAPQDHFGEANYVYPANLSGWLYPVSGYDCEWLMIDNAYSIMDYPDASYKQTPLEPPN